MGGLDPSLERKDMAISSGVGDLKKRTWLAYNGSIPRAVGAMIYGVEGRERREKAQST